LLLLLPVDFCSPPWLLRLLPAPPDFDALARSSCAALSGVVALPPLLAAPDLAGADFELPDFMGNLLGLKAGHHSPAHQVTLGSVALVCVG
jgi:hypothetical protein